MWIIEKSHIYGGAVTRVPCEVHSKSGGEAPVSRRAAAQGPFGASSLARRKEAPAEAEIRPAVWARHPTTHRSTRPTAPGAEDSAKDSAAFPHLSGSRNTVQIPLNIVKYR